MWFVGQSFVGQPTSGSTANLSIMNILSLVRKRKEVMARRIISTLTLLWTLIFIPRVISLHVTVYVNGIIILLWYKVMTLLPCFNGFGQPVVNH